MNKLGSFFTSGQFNPMGASPFGVSGASANPTSLLGNPLMGSTGQNLSLQAMGGFKMGVPAASVQQSFDSQNSWDPINKQWFSTGN
jgi:hypothetical protein